MSQFNMWSKVRFVATRKAYYLVHLFDRLFKQLDRG